jgi:hypothetical protein
MSADPFRDRPLSAEEVRAVIERAAALAKVDVAAGKAGHQLSAAELEQRLRELGLGPEIVRQALEPVVSRETVAPGSGRGIDREVIIDGELPVEEFEAIADAIASVMKMQGSTSAVGHRLTWTPGGRMTEPAVTVSVKNGRTSIRYVETTAKQAPVAVGVASGLAGSTVGGMGALAAAGVAQSLGITAAQGAPAVLVYGALLAVSVAVASFVGLRRSNERFHRHRATFSETVLAHVAREVVSRVEKGPRMRVEGASEAERVVESEDAGEVEAPRRTATTR